MVDRDVSCTILKEHILSSDLQKRVFRRFGRMDYWTFDGITRHIFILLLLHTFLSIYKILNTLNLIDMTFDSGGMVTMYFMPVQAGPLAINCQEVPIVYTVYYMEV